ncbi:Ap-3 complex subunit beta-2 [Plakobranchus ocellatus]|uniref:Ap-3 complex subunit beta-2 n=1 Tax=Plakobranchus ocellatus TaxID=259542 RepID=A0AAV3Z904_9GAST|nr:Ap-3 complex subunit beta-2 [Plakobranchus ocellatus]
MEKIAGTTTTARKEQLLHLLVLVMSRQDQVDLRGLREANRGLLKGSLGQSQQTATKSQILAAPTPLLSAETPSAFAVKSGKQRKIPSSTPITNEHTASKLTTNADQFQQMLLKYMYLKKHSVKMQVHQHKLGFPIPITTEFKWWITDITWKYRQSAACRLVVWKEKDVTTSSEERRVPLDDRVKNQEAMVLSFIAKNNLPVSMSTPILSIAQELSRDTEAMKRVKVEHRTTSYKLQYGVAKTILDELLAELRVNKFSLNIDKAMNAQNQKIVSVLVSHFSEKEPKVVTNHLSSFELIKVTSESLFSAIDDIFINLELPWDNLISIMMDSCHVMRCSKTGLEKRESHIS